MRSFLFALIFVLMSCINSLIGQVPQRINYQAVVRNVEGEPIMNQNIYVRFSIKENSANGFTLYQEVHSATSNTQGLINVQIGGGNPSLGEFPAINWGNYLPKYLQVEIDTDGDGLQPFVDMGTHQLVSVPYALYSENTGHLQGYPVSSDSPTTNALLQWNGNNWAPAQVSGGSNSGWLLTGNQGTNPDVNFIGTTDFNPLVFKMNSALVGRVDYNNVFWGKDAGLNNAASLNVGIGTNALKTNSIGNLNVAVGNFALESNIDGISNVAIGPYAINTNASPTDNTAMGVNAMRLSLGNENVAIGSHAMFANSGSGNVAVGGGASSTEQSPSNYCTFLGNNSYFYPAFGNNNSTALGYLSFINADNKVRLGNTAVTIVEGPVVYTTSDARFKEKVVEEVHGLDFITKLRPVAYNYKAREHQQSLMRHLPDSLQQKFLATLDFTTAETTRQSGFIAQEVELAAQQVGYDFSGIHTPQHEGDYYSLSYAEFVVPLVKAVQEQQAMIEELKSQITKLQNQINTPDNK